MAEYSAAIAYLRFYHATKRSLDTGEPVSVFLEEFDNRMREHDREVIGEYRSNLLKTHERLRKKPGYSVRNLLSFIINDSNPVDFDGVE